LIKVPAKYFFIIGIFVLFTGCSTKRNTLLSRSYHNLNTHYNVYFNGSESFRKGVKKVNDAFVDNYSEILPVFTYEDEKALAVAAGEMDRAALKSTKAITVHSITAKPNFKNKSMTKEQRDFYNQKEFNKWIDECYLMIGKSHFYRHHYDMAIETFNYILSNYDKTNSKLETMIWLARADNEIEEYNESEKLLASLASNKKLSRKLMVEALATYADFYIKQEDYSGAIPKLKLAIEKCRNKHQKTRYMYILAQLYQATDNNALASEMYLGVVKKNPPYEMAFNAKINLAGTYETGSGNAEKIKSQLRKMLRDSKNKEYLDQIYYAIGNIEYKENKIPEAVRDYTLSSNNSVKNDHQKAMSCVALADIYYSMPKYVLAGCYYDTALLVIDENYPNYSMIQRKAKNLSSLVKNINIVKNEDSLQRIAKMSEKERFAIIDDLIAKVKLAEIEAQNEEAQRKQNIAFSNSQSSSSSTGSTTTTGKWYFYNPSTMGFGQTEFQTKWGRRKLEDNWRRKNKKVVAVSADEEEKEDAESTDNSNGTKKSTKKYDNKSREYYLANLPLTDSLMIVSNEKVKNALFNIGSIYADELQEAKLSAEAFEELMRRFPESDFSQAACFELYNLFTKLGNKQKADYYKNVLIKKYPDSKYTEMITNPNYLNDIKEKDKAVNRMYEGAYSKYVNGNYPEALIDCNSALNKYPKHELVPKFKFLRALAIGKTSDVKVFRDALNQYITEYPKTEASSRAKDIIVAMNKVNPVMKQEEDVKIAEEIYKPLKGGNFFFVLSIDSKPDVNQLTFNLVNFNLDNFTNSNYTLNSEELDKNTQVIAVKTMPDSLAALKYYNLAVNSKGLFKDVKSQNYKMFIISNQHYAILQKDKSVEKYFAFFRKNYKIK
jgi:outer membrane protein assembly factor BamD (BamD/ComL family)